jgi:chemotaxis protein CheY-P-specific phosphatase CheC
MATPVLICDDSSFARKQMARALPSDWDVSIDFASNGLEGLEAIKAGKASILFLDLNMPVMDGYEVLQAIRDQDLNTMVIVVSGDIQPDAYNRVMSLGALEFVKKPVDREEILSILTKYGIRGEPARNPPAAIDIQVDIKDGFKEIANIAMGRAADLLARLLGAFVIMPIPKVDMIEVSELEMALSQVGGNESVSAICQGFIGAGIAGEALLIFNKSSYTDIAQLLNFEGEIDKVVELELLMDTANILIGACLKGIAEQMDVNFSQGHPIVLGRHVEVGTLLKRNASRWTKMLSIEMGCSIENRNVNCDLLLLFTEDSLATLNSLFAYLAD